VELIDSTRFQLVAKIAEGGMGTVYRAAQVGISGFTKQVAIKTLNREASNDPEFVEMFIGEARLVADLVHQNIVQIYQLGKAGGQLYIAMELISGCNLQELITAHTRQGRVFPLDIAAFIVSRVCRGLAYAHEKRGKNGALLGVVHRDISPKNVLITWEGVVKIGDWGIAKARDLMIDNEGHVLLGKSAYMSPEQAAFQTTDARSDIFSLGIVFYELLSGRPLFGTAEVEETVAILDRVIHSDAPPIRDLRPEVSEVLATILQRSLARDLGTRYPSAREMGDDLEHFMYDKGFGPTNESLARYLNEVFPAAQVPAL
jgi:serine/threonine-protein kinase